MTEEVIKTEITTPYTSTQQFLSNPHSEVCFKEPGTQKRMYRCAKTFSCELLKYLG